MKAGLATMEQSEITTLDKKAAEGLIKLFESKQKNSVAIICHDQPDPDCIASAMAVSMIADSYGLTSTIYYGGEIPYTQNSVMMNVLNINAIKLEIDEDNEEESAQLIRNALEKSYVVVVDTSCGFGKENNTGIAAFIDKDRKADVVIDHHSPNPSLDCVYIHKAYGSCSTILYEIMNDLKILDAGATGMKALATALYLGISTDTADLKSEGTTENDRVALETLKGLVDVELLRKIYDYPKPLALLELRRRAYSNVIICGNNLTIASVGMINPQQRALLAKLCEEMLEIESIDSALVMGLVDAGFDKPKYLIASFRTQVLAINVQQFVQRIFGKKHGGGRRGAGAAKVPLDDKLCAVIDFVRRQPNGSELSVDKLIEPFFHLYATKTRDEKDNI